jgi:FG-GAP-like repeat
VVATTGDFVLGGSAGVLLGNGDGTFQPLLTYSSLGNGADTIAVADVNGDGRPDILVVNNCSSSQCSGSQEGTMGVLLNNSPFCASPPTVTVSTTPSFLWPPNGKMVAVVVSGTITDTGCTVTTAAYAVTDEYGEVQPNGPVTLGPEDVYSFTVFLEASRRGSDINGSTSK